MSITDLIYAYIPCPVCGKDDFPLRAWASMCYCDDDGHANGVEIGRLECDHCNDIEISDINDDVQNDNIVTVIEEIEQSLLYRATCQIGTIHNYRPVIS